jgi:two-component system, LytTR family, sensor kinase
VPRNYVTIITHVALWTVFLGAPILFSNGRPATFTVVQPVENRWWVPLGLNVCLVLFFYLNYSLLLPRFYVKGETKKYFFSILTVYACFQLVIVVFRKLAFAENPQMAENDAIIRMSHAISTGFFLLMWAASSGFKLSEEWRNAEVSHRKTDQRRLEAELALIKSQINPHFLLNTLNNLYAISLTTPEKTPDGILKLSEMVTYILYECDKTMVPLAHDLAFIENYLSLQRLRLPPNAVLYIEMPPIGKRMGQLEPMLLIPFIENAFKHGLTTQKPCKIFISIQFLKNILVLHVENDVFPQKTNKKSDESGIGLSHTRQRLEHSYAHEHTLTIENNGSKHLVKLTLKVDLPNIKHTLAYVK